MSDTTVGYYNDATGERGRITPAEARELVLDRLSRIEAEEITSYYTGREGCACGCRGTYRYAAHAAEAEGERRGYALEEDEVVEVSSVRRLLTNLRKRVTDTWVEDVMVFETPERGLSITTDSGSGARVCTLWMR